MLSILAYLATLVSAGSPCATAAGQSCSLGSLASSASIRGDYVAMQNTAGSVTFTVQVAGSENDPTTSNNQVSNTTTVTFQLFQSA